VFERNKHLLEMGTISLVPKWDSAGTLRYYS
jgi:hypothetical protein